MTTPLNYKEVIAGQVTSNTIRNTASDHMPGEIVSPSIDTAHLNLPTDRLEPKKTSQQSWQELLNEADKKEAIAAKEPVAGWLDNSLDSFPAYKPTPELPKVQDTSKDLNAIARKALAEEALRLERLAEKDAKKHIGQYKDSLDPLFEEAYTMKAPAVKSKPIKPSPQEEAILKSYYDAFTNASDFAAKKQSSELPLALDKLTEKLNTLEKQISSLNNTIGNKQAEPARAEVGSGRVAAATNTHELNFTDSDLRDLENMLDGFDKKHAPPIVEYTQPTIEDLRKFAKILDGAEVMGMSSISNSPVATPNDLHTYLEREAVMAKTKSGWITEPDGTTKHYKNGVLHADGDQPAEVRPNGTNLYYKNGSLHRDGNLPAMVGIRGTAKFAVDGKYHRLGGLPAITWSKGPYRHEYWINGEIIRAVKKDGTQEWYAPGSSDREDAILHRADGPAVIHPNNREEFWLNGNQFNTREQWLGALSRLNDMKEEALDQELIDEDPVDEIYVDTTDDAPVTIKESKKNKKEKTMNKPSFAENLKANAVSAGFRVAGTQLTTAVKGAILTVMRNKGADGGAIQAFSAFLDTEFGAAMISFMIGSGLPYIPMYGENPSVARLATEMQVGGMATAGNAIIGEAMQHVLPAITQILQTLPSVDGETTSNVRVIESKESKLAETLMDEEEETDTTETSAKTMNA